MIARRSFWPVRPAARALAGFWVAVLLLAGGGAAALQLLGPPKLPRLVRDIRPPAPPAKQAALPRPPASRSSMAPAPAMPALEAERAVLVAPPDPDLAEPAPDFAGRLLPRLGPDGLAPARAYASQAGLPAHGPQVAILLEDIGLAEETTAAAIELPPAISLGVSPYAPSFDLAGEAGFLQAARHAGHETWMSLPMEPAGSPLDEEGAQSLSTANDLDVDRLKLEWALSRCQGYVGVTNALSGLRGGRFASSSSFPMVTTALAKRGLLYLDAGGVSVPPASPANRPDPAVRHADVTIDEEPDAADIEARLSRLEQLARDHGSALGVAGPLRPVVIERLQAWSRHLADRGITLVPVSALPPPAMPALAGPGSPERLPGDATAPVVPPPVAAPDRPPPVAAVPADASSATRVPSGPP